MSFGVLFLNDSNRVQIDENTPVLSLIQKGTATATTAVMGSPTTRAYTLTLTGRTAPLLAIGVEKPSQGEKGFQIVEVVRNGGSWTYTIMIWHQYGTDFGFRWYLFDLPYGTPLIGYGLAVWDAQGRLVFNSNHAPMRSVTAMAAGRSYAAVYYAPFILNESWSWDTAEQRDRVTWSLYCEAVATYPGAGWASGYVDGGESFSGPTIPWPNTQSGGGPLSPLFVEVTGL
ncbi:hypothetical protein [uncultured Brevundimonas sp.]|uniref:hypothetical protein n=1 Tax=uncultured Brevundimonas sp. TaxID=213418 RepID=UPI0025E96112|nr:hypothetical protein [uncultured Brevundimonas sp.]